MVVKGTYYTMYIPYHPPPPPPTQLAQLRKTVEPTLKIEKFVIRTPHQALIQDFDLGGLAEPRGVTKFRSQSIGSTVNASLLEQFQQSESL